MCEFKRERRSENETVLRSSWQLTTWSRETVGFGKELVVAEANMKNRIFFPLQRKVMQNKSLVLSNFLREKKNTAK